MVQLATGGNGQAASYPHSTAAAARSTACESRVSETRKLHKRLHSDEPSSLRDDTLSAGRVSGSRPSRQRLRLVCRAFPQEAVGAVSAHRVRRRREMSRCVASTRHVPAVYPRVAHPGDIKCLFAGNLSSPLTDSNRRPPPYHGGSGAVRAITAGHRRARFSCKSPDPPVPLMSARDRACSTSCTRLVPASRCLF